jgi:hypothetical protein
MKKLNFPAIKKNKKHLIKILPIATILVIISSNNAQAFDLGGSMFNQLYQQLSNRVNTQLQAAQSYLNTYASDQIKSWGQQAKQEIADAVSNSTGALGLPDIFKVKDTAKTVNNPNSTINISDAAVIDAISNVTNANASSILSQQGQDQIKQESDRIAGLVQDSSTVASNVDALNNVAQNADSTQDVVKQLAAQNAALAKQQAQLASVSGSVNSNLQTLNQQQAIANVNLDRINQTTAGQTQQKNMEVLSLGRENYTRASRASLSIGGGMER